MPQTRAGTSRILLVILALFIAACSSVDTTSSSTTPVDDSPEAETRTDEFVTPTTERLTAPMNVELVADNLRIQGFPDDAIADVIDCLDEQAQAESLDFLAADSEEFAVFLVRCSPNFLALASSAGIQAPPGVARIQVICAGEVMLRQIGALPLAEAADQLLRPDPAIRPEWIEGVATACELSQQNAELVLGQ